MSGKPLMLLTALWLLARVAWLLNLPIGIVALLDSLFLPLVALQMARSLWPVRQVRNYPLVLVLLLLAVANLVTLYGVATANDNLQRQATVGGLWFVAAMMSMIGGRVIPSSPAHILFFIEYGFNGLLQKQFHILSYIVSFLYLLRS